jgi:hypothetical protein
VKSNQELKPSKDQQTNQSFSRLYMIPKGIHKSQIEKAAPRLHPDSLKKYFGQYTKAGGIYFDLADHPKLIFCSVQSPRCIAS